MALINCPECSREISDKAESCPHCGFPVEKLSKQQTQPEAPPTIVCCLDCQKEYPFADEVCPYCGLFNSQKYQSVEEPITSKPPIPFIWVSEKDGYISIKCPQCHRVSKIKNNLVHKTDFGYSISGDGTCPCSQTFNKIYKTPQTNGTNFKLKPLSKVAAFFIAFVITCIGNLAIHVPYIAITNSKMPMGLLSIINVIIFILTFSIIPKKHKTST